MTLTEALAVWAYTQHQIKLQPEARAARDKAWNVINEEAGKQIYPDVRFPTKTV
jgi:hypothetical protein